jgi:cytoskeleton protein RodZ
MGEQDNTHDRRAAAMPGPGASLRDERLRRQLSVAQIAESLHLDQATITRLEADDYSALPPLTFVRGYLRAYAQWLELDADDLIRRLDAMGLVEESAPLKAHAGMTATTAKRPRPAGRTPGIALLTGLLITGLGVVGAGAWYLTDRGLALPGLSDMAEAVDEAQTPDPPDPASASTPAPTQSDPAPDGELQSSMTAESTPPDPDADSATTAQASRVPEATAADSTPDEASEPDEALAPDEASEAPASEAPQGDEAMASTADSAGTASGADITAESAPAPETVTEAVEQQTIELTYTGDSWMEIRDDRGERLIFGMARPGTARVEGAPPFDIVVGNIDHVTLRYQGEPVNLGAYARQKVARFTLGTDQ